MLTQISVADDNITEKYKNHIPAPEVRFFLEQIAQSGTDTLAGMGMRIYRGELWERLSEKDKDFVTNGLQFVEMATRDLTGSTMRTDELMMRWASTLPLPGDTVAVLNTKQANREAALEGLVAKIPPQAIAALKPGKNNGK